LNDIDTPQHLSAVTIAYAVMFTVAALVLLSGLVARVILWRRQRASSAPRAGMPARDGGFAPGRIFMDLVLFRGKFFDDRVSWICSILFHYGLLCVLLRHLRYAIDPAWMGPFWTLVVLAQPVGLYGGLVMMAGIAGFLARRLLIPDLRARSTFADYALLALLLAVPSAGYLNAFFHTDIVQVKWFFLGLASLDWQPLPKDPLLLLHLWLVAALMMAIPFSKLLHMGGVFETALEARTARALLRERSRGPIAWGVGVVLIVPALVAGVAIATEGWHGAGPDLATLAQTHRADDPTLMIRYHPAFLFAHRAQVVHQGIRAPGENIETCVTCHAVKGKDGQPVGFDDPNHFCRACHAQVAVSIDCFECHNARPTAVTKMSFTADAAEGSAVR
jgi:nitrate reductase gamma subunit